MNAGKPIPWGDQDSFSFPVRRANSDYPTSSTLPMPAEQQQILTPDSIRHTLRTLGLTESLVIHQQGYDQFMEERGLRELGRGGEGAVYFLRGHVVKVVRSDSAPAALREIAHMLYLNGISKDGSMGERAHEDWPSLLWVYVLSDGSLSIGMRPFDRGERLGGTLYERLHRGPAFERMHCLLCVRYMARSIAYAQRNGIVHHDLKPSNIFIPADRAQPPVIFDLGQALWKQSSWGRRWLKHEHNVWYWYNGTYRYMHLQRRMAHLAALASVQKAPPLPAQTEAFNAFQPGFYDDVFAFARVLRDMVCSRYSGLTAHDRGVLTALYRDLMGLHAKRTLRGGSERGTSRIFQRIKAVFGPPPGTSEHPAESMDVQKRWPSMEAVEPATEQVVSDLLKL